MDRPAPVRSSHFVARRQSVLFKRGQPALHRPSAPSLVKDGGVAQDVVEMLNGRVYHRMVLMKSVRATDPAHRHSRRGGALREIGVLAAIAALALAESPEADQVLAVMAHDRRGIPHAALDGLAQRHRTRPPRLTPQPTNRGPTTSAPRPRHAPHVVELRTSHHVLTQRPRPTHFDAHWVIAFMQREHVRAQSRSGRQRQRIPVGPHAESHARTGNEIDRQKALIRNVRYSSPRSGRSAVSQRENNADLRHVQRRDSRLPDPG
jgi:hypothetical protein